MAIKIVQVVNIWNVHKSVGITASQERAYINPNNYNGSLIWYFEFVSYTDFWDGTVYLKDSGNSTTYASQVVAAGNIRYRVVIASPPVAATEFAVFGDADNPYIKTARIIILQNAGSALTATETQIEIGSYQLTITASAYTALVRPKYWLYTAANWDGTKVFSAEVVYACSSTKGLMYARLEEDDGAFANWAEKVVIVSAGNGTVPIRVRVTFTPTDGRNYRIAVYTTGSKYPPDIYCGKIVVTQTGTITKLETAQTILNAYINIIGLQDRDIYYDPAEWEGVTKDFYHEHDAGSVANTSKLQSDPNGTPADIANSSITGTYRTRGGTALTMPDTAKEIDTYHVSGSSLSHSKLIAVIVISTGASYSESVALAGAAAFSNARITNVAGAMSLSGAAALTDVRRSDLVAARTLPAAAGISESGAWDGFGATSLAGSAALAPVGGISFVNDASLPGSAAITEAANIAALRELGLTCEAGFALGSVLAAGSSVSLTSGAGLAEARVAALLGSAGLPGAAATVEQSLLAALESLGLPVNTGISEAALLETLKSISLSSSGALELLSSLIAQGALVLSGDAGLGADGIVEGLPGQNYYESQELSSLAAIVKSALMETLSSSALPGAANISIASLIQAVNSARIEASGALMPDHILDRLAAAEFDGAAGVSLGTFLQAINSVLLSASGSISPTAVNAALNLLALAVVADMATSAWFEASNETSLEALAEIATALVYEMGAQLGYAGLAGLALQSSLAGNDLISLAASGQMERMAQNAFAKILGLAGAAAQQSAAALARSGAVSFPALGNLEAAVQLGLVKSCSLAGIASLETSKQISCAGFLALQSISALVPYLGPGVKRGYRLELILDELELDLKLN